MTSGIWDVEAIRNCTHECEYAPPTPRLSTVLIYSDFPVARALQGRPHVRRSRAADEHRTPLQNDGRRTPGSSAYRHVSARSSAGHRLHRIRPSNVGSDNPEPSICLRGPRNLVMAPDAQME